MTIPPPAAAASDTPIPPDTHLRDGGHSDTTLARARLAIGGALLTAYLFTRPWGTEGTLEGAAAWADPRWPLSHLAAMVGFTGLVDQATRIAERFIPDPPKTADEHGPKYIPGRGEETTRPDLLPVTALAREVLRILGTIQNMLDQTRDMLVSGATENAQDVNRMEDKVNALFKAVRAYAVDLTRKGLNEQEQRKVTALLRYTASLEHAGDVICKTMLAIPETMRKDRKSFSEAGQDELGRLFDYLTGNAQLAAEVIMSWHPDTGSVLVQRKRDFKKMCNISSRQHIKRLANDVSNAMASSSAHLDLISDMRWINTQVASIGYDALPQSEDSGDEAAEQLIKHPE